MIKVSIDHEVMQNVMSGVAEQIKRKIDLNHIKKLCKKRYGINTIENIKHKDANIVIIENQPACKLDFNVHFSMSVLITTKEDLNNTLTEYDDMPEGLDDIRDEIDEIQAELITLDKTKK